MRPGAAGSAIAAAVKEAWAEGYQAAIAALREIACETKDADRRLIIVSVANLLQSLKP